MNYSLSFYASKPYNRMIKLKRKWWQIRYRYRKESGVETLRHSLVLNEQEGKLLLLKSPEGPIFTMLFKAMGANNIAQVQLEEVQPRTEYSRTNLVLNSNN